MEKSKFSTDKYEKKQRKKLKSAKVNNNLRNILENRVILRTEGKTRNNCMSFEKNESIKLKKNSLIRIKTLKIFLEKIKIIFLLNLILIIIKVKKKNLLFIHLLKIKVLEI